MLIPALKGPGRFIGCSGGGGAGAGVSTAGDEGPVSRYAFRVLSRLALVAVVLGAVLFVGACGEDTSPAPAGPAGAAGAGASGGAGSAGAAGASAGASGSKPSSAPTKPADVATEEAFNLLADKVQCELHAGCCAAEGRVPDPTCLQDRTLLNGLPADAAHYDPARGAACIDALKALGCGFLPDTDDVCRVVRTAAFRTKAGGEECAVDSDCVDPVGGYAVCGGTVNPPFFCKHYLLSGEGEPCGFGDVNKVCDHPLLCDEQAHLCVPYQTRGTGCFPGCDEGKRCVFGACAEPGAKAGSKCDDDTTCDSLRCVEGVCTSLGLGGDDCSADLDCESGFCIPNTHHCLTASRQIFACK